MLKLRNLSVSFLPGTPDERRAVDNIDLTVAPGEFVTVIGGNGAGKSTLFGTVGGSVPTDSGSIVLDGQDITLLPEHKRARLMGRLFQDPLQGTAPSLTIEENLALAHLRGRRRTLRFGLRKSDADYFREILAPLELGLEDRMKTKVGLLSGGQRQALTLMMATINRPKLLLLDEHTAALDPATAEKVERITRRIVREQGITCLMITHNISSALSMGSRTIMMDRGQILLDLSGREREEMTVERLLAAFRDKSNKELEEDRILFSSFDASAS